MIVAEPTFNERAIDEEARQVIASLAHSPSLEKVAAQRSTKAVRKDMLQGKLGYGLVFPAIKTILRWEITCNNTVIGCWHGGLTFWQCGKSIVYATKSDSGGSSRARSV